MRGTSRFGSGALALLAALSWSCGDDDGPPPPVDAGNDAPQALDATVDAEIRAPIPLEPALPVFTPCPAGWREVAEKALGGASRCEPWPATGRETCAPGSIHLPGTPTCELVTTACPPDGWPADLPTGAPVVFVSAAAAPGGDGTRALPFAAIADAYAVVPDGGIIALSVGTYNEPLVVYRSVTIWGACNETRLERTTAGSTQFQLRDGVVSIQNLTIAGLRPIWITGGEVELRRIVLTDITRVAIDVSGATLLIDRMSLDSGDSLMDSGVDAAVTVRNASVTATRYGGVAASSGTVLVEGSVFSGIGEGAAATALASVTRMSLMSVPTVVRFERCVFYDNYTSAFYATEGGRLELVDVVVRPIPMASGDAGIGVFEASTGLLERVFLDGPNFQGIAIGEPRSTAELRDVWIRDVIPDAASGRGQGVEVALGGSATLDRVLIERSTGLAVLASDGTLAAHDLLIRDVAPRFDAQFGRALQVQVGAEATVERLRVEGAHEVAVVVAGGRAVLELVDAIIVDTAANECPAGTCPGAGIGLGAYVGGRIDASRFLLRGNALAGAQVAYMGELDLSDGEVSDQPVGVNIQVDGYDVDRLTRNVVYLRNGTNLDSTSLPVPSPTTE